MMKRAFLVLVTLAAFAGCGNDTGSGNGVGSGGPSSGDASASVSDNGDGSTSTADGSSTTVADLAVRSDGSTGDGSTAALSGCHNLRLCENACKTDQACAKACMANATKQAKKLYQALLDCHDQVCGPPKSGPCMNNCDCRPNSDAMGGACSTQYNACINDLP